MIASGCHEPAWIRNFVVCQIKYLKPSTWSKESFAVVIISLTCAHKDMDMDMNMDMLYIIIVCMQSSLIMLHKLALDSRERDMKGKHGVEDA